MKKITTLLSALVLTAFGFNANAQCTAPTIGANTNLTSTSVTVNWTETGSATTWDIELVVGGGGTPTGSPTHPGITTNPYILTGLAPSSAYKVLVRAVCNGTPGNWSGFNFILTPAAGITCDKPNNLTATNITTTSADLGWTDGVAGTPASWIIEYGPTGFAQGTAAGTVVTATANPYNLTGLTVNTTYDFYITADCGTTDGLSSITSPTVFSTITTGIDMIANNIKIATYPNPTTGVFTLNVNTTDVNELNIKVMNMQGQVVFTKNNFDNIATIQEQIDLSANANGIYIVTITSDKGVITHKVTVQ